LESGRAHESIRLGDEGIDEANVSIYDAVPGKAKKVG
jgi:hypothetical protein